MYANGKNRNIKVAKKLGSKKIDAALIFNSELKRAIPLMIEKNALGHKIYLKGGSVLKKNLKRKSITPYISIRKEDVIKIFNIFAYDMILGINTAANNIDGNTVKQNMRMILSVIIKLV